MEWLSQNWVWVLIGVAFIAMHMFGHGGHGGHGGHADSGRDGRRKSHDSTERCDESVPPRHQH